MAGRDPARFVFLLKTSTPLSWPPRLAWRFPAQSTAKCASGLAGVLGPRMLPRPIMPSVSTDPRLGGGVIMVMGR
jgi:hypothetical protein